VHQVDIYKIDFKNETDTLTWQKIDSLLLTGREASEVQIYPQYGRVIVDLFGRVLLWDYAPINRCACLLVARPRRNYGVRSGVSNLPLMLQSSLNLHLIQYSSLTPSP
jgi:hypothetical protein